MRYIFGGENYYIAIPPPPICQGGEWLSGGGGGGGGESTKNSHFSVYGSITPAKGSHKFFST